MKSTIGLAVSAAVDDALGDVGSAPTVGDASAAAGAAWRRARAVDADLAGSSTRSDALVDGLVPVASEALADDGDPVTAVSTRSVCRDLGPAVVALRAVRAEDALPGVELLADESAGPPEAAESAEATGMDAIATPTPSATARPPTRPTQRA